jgi:hypothetical protein
MEIARIKTRIPNKLKAAQKIRFIFRKLSVLFFFPAKATTAVSPPHQK